MRKPSPLRRRPPSELRQRLLDIQRNKCFYCGIKFGQLAYYNKKFYYLIPHYDHYIPFAYLQSNPNDNWIAACFICNGIKGSKIFDTLRELLQHIREERNNRVVETYNYKEMPFLPQAIPDKKGEQKVLQTIVPLEILGQKKSKIEKYKSIRICIFCETSFGVNNNIKYCSEQCKKLDYLIAKVERMELNNKMNQLIKSKKIGS